MTSSDEAHENPERRHALLVGCDHYDDAGLPDLRCSINDVHAMETVLSDSTRGGFRSVQVIPPEAESHLALEQIEQFIADLRQSDLFVFYFSGHGLQDLYDNLYLGMRTTRLKALQTTAIPVSSLITLIQNGRPQSVVLILDCCFSGAVNEAFSVIKSSKNLYIMTSSTSAQESYEKEGSGNSYFTQFLVDGIRDGRADRDSDGRVSVDDAYLYAYNLLKAAPTPQESIRFLPSGARGELLLARNPNVRRLHPELLSASHIVKFNAVRTMIQLVESKEYAFMVTFNFADGKYYIEGEPYSTLAFTVSPGHTPNLMQTQGGFECDAFYEPHMISPQGLRGKEVINNRVKVRMRVDLDDIMLIIGTPIDSGEQIRLL